jgi:hypothetical protein
MGLHVIRRSGRIVWVLAERGGRQTNEDVASEKRDLN